MEREIDVSDRGFIMRFRCEKCGKFLPYNGFISYTEFSGASEFSPREPRFLCVPCYEQSDKNLLDRISWIKPHIVTIK